MRVSLALCITLCSFLVPPAISAAAQAQSSPYDAVDPIIGTDGDGNTFPGASLPFGMVQWSPDTNTEAWYIHHQKQIYGFGLTHVSGAGCPLYGDFAVVPTTGTLTSSPATGLNPYAAQLDHTNEAAHPGYYAVTLEMAYASKLLSLIAPASLASSSRVARPLVSLSTPAAAPTPTSLRTIRNAAANRMATASSSMVPTPSEDRLPWAASADRTRTTNST